MAKSKFVGPMPEDDAPIPDEVKVERKGTKKSSVPEVSDKDAKSAPKPTRVGATSADREAIILDKTSSRADKRAANKAQVAELDDYIKKMANPGGDDSAPIPTRVDTTKSSGMAKPNPRVGSPSRPNRGAASSSASNRGGSPSPAPSKPAAKPVDSRSKGSLREVAKQSASVPLAKLKPGSTPGPIERATTKAEAKPKVKAKSGNPMTSKVDGNRPIQKVALPNLDWGPGSDDWLPNESNKQRSKRIQIKQNIDARENNKVKPKTKPPAKATKRSNPVINRTRRGYD